jgi:hypothetical protein
MDPRLPTSIDRRQGFYIAPKRSKSPTKEPSTEIHKNQNLKKEIEENIEPSTPSSPSKKSIEWKFIKKPSPSRLTLEPEGGKKYLFSDRTIEKMVFGDYFLVRYLMKRTQNACFIYPDMMLAVDAISFIYQMKDMGIPFTTDVLTNWDSGSEGLTQIIQKYPSLIEKYERTREIIKDNLKEIKNALRPNQQGPRLERSNPQYHRLIYLLIERMMDKQKINFDTSGKEEFVIPYECRLKNCILSRRRFIVFFIRLNIEDSYHSNMMIIDKKNKTIDRFEPQGGPRRPLGSRANYWTPANSPLSQHGYGLQQQKIPQR